MPEVFYRKWRPKVFSDIVGQDTISKILLNSVASNRIAHSYIFTGPRGSGKTSTARILSKAINCSNSNNGEPDISCESCISIENKTSLDLIEIDAASNRGIDDIRDLSDKINFVPNKSKYKVYIIDEVHMLTDPAFNALLKTLEEPPEHAVFILATTDIDKVPLTIISRCHRLDFKRVSLQSIIMKLQLICKKEGISSNNKELDLIARQSHGSLRDAENLLEQVVVAYGTELNLNDISEFLHTDNYDRAFELVKLILDKKLRDSLVNIDLFNQSGIDIKNLLKSIIEILRALILFKNDITTNISFSTNKIEKIMPFAQNYKLNEIMYAIKKFNDIYLKNKSFTMLDIELAIVDISENNQSNKNETLPLTINDSHINLTENENKVFDNLSENINIATAQENLNNENTSTSHEIEYSFHKIDNDKTEDKFDNLEKKDNINSNETISEQNWLLLKKQLRNVGKRFKIGALLNVSKERFVIDHSLVITFTHKSHVERLENEIKDPSVNKEIASILQEILIDVKDIKPRNSDNIKQLINKNSSHLVRSAQNFGAQIFEKNEVNNE
tara:strand:+ start:44846 stop:46525 length:1680 start_codon:yes stop_codon:yes gene_type:complete